MHKKTDMVVCTMSVSIFLFSAAFSAAAAVTMTGATLMLFHCHKCPYNGCRNDCQNDKI